MSEEIRNSPSPNPDDGRPLLRRDDPIRVVGRQGGDGERAFELRYRGPHRLFEGASEIFFDEVDDDLGVGLGPERVPLRAQFPFQGEVVLDNAVVDDDQAARAVHMGMSVFLARPAVRRPPRMAEAASALHGRFAEAVFELLDLAFDPPDLDRPPVDDCDPGRVIAAVFEFFQPVDEDRDNALRPDIAHDAAHMPPLSENSVFGLFPGRPLFALSLGPTRLLELAAAGDGQ